jgi:hypothetical protein
MKLAEDMTNKKSQEELSVNPVKAMEGESTFPTLSRWMEQAQRQTPFCKHI